MAKIIDNDNIDYEELDKEFENQLVNKEKELSDLKIELAEIGNPEKLTNSISQIVWEQFILQIAGTAGQDFIKSNHDLTLSLSKADHILSEENFIKGDLPKHNFDNIDKYQQRYDDYFNSLKRDENGNVVYHETRTGNKEATIASGARKIFDEGRPTGSNDHNTSMDHTISAAEILRDTKAATFMDTKEKVDFANSETNLNEIDKGWNASKSDMSTSDWLNNPNKNGQKPEDIFNNMSEKDKEELLEKDAKARAEFEKRKNEAEQKAIEEGKESIKKEALRSATFTTQAIVVALCAKLTRTVFQEVIVWLMQKNKKASELLKHIKKAIKDFFFDFKKNLLLSVDVGLTTVLSQIFGSIVSTIRRALLFFKIGGETFYNVGKYLKSPENANKPTDLKILDIGRIVTIGFTAAGAIGLGVAISSIIQTHCPPIALLQIPLLGSAGNLIGIFLGGLISGVCGAIVLHQIDGALEGQKKRENIEKQIIVGNDILALQNEQFNLYTSMINNKANSSCNNIKENHLRAIEEIKKANDSLVVVNESDNSDTLDEISSSVDKWDV